MSNENLRLLSIIDDIEDVVLESEYDVLNAMYSEYQKVYQISEYSSDINASMSLFMEATTETKSTNGFVRVLRKIWSLIKSALNALKNVFKRIFGIANKTTGQATSTPNQILQKLTVNTNAPSQQQPPVANSSNNAEDKPASQPKTPEQTPTTDTPVNEPTTPASSNNNASKAVSKLPSETINIPADESSEPEFKNQKAKVYHGNPIFIGLDESKHGKIYFKMNHNKQVRTKHIYDDSRYGEASIDFIDDKILKALKAILNKNVVLEYFDSIYQAAKIIFDAAEKTDNEHVFHTVILKRYNEALEVLIKKYKAYKAIEDVTIPDDSFIDVETVLEFQKDLDNMTDKFDVLVKICDLIEQRKETFSEDAVRSLKIMAQKYDDALDIIFHIQMGLNAINAGYENIWIPDKKFFNTIKDFNELDKFVAEMIKHHIPQKAIMKAAWLCSSSEIKGDSDKYKPIWGQMRGCFIPPKQNYIYKIALSQRSLIDNKTESSVYEKGVREHKPYTNILTKVIKHGDNYAALMMEKVYGIGKLRTDKNAYNEIMDFFNDSFGNTKGFYISDLHANNIGFRKQNPSEGDLYTVNNEPVILDYADIHLN